MSLQDVSLDRCFDDLAQIDADLRALDTAPYTTLPPRLIGLMRACCRRLRERRECRLVRLQLGPDPAPRWPARRRRRG